AVDLTDLLIEKGVPFRTAYRIIGKLVKKIKNNNRTLSDLNENELIDEVYKTCGIKVRVSSKEIKAAVDPNQSIKKRKHIGGPSPLENMRMAKERKSVIKKMKRELNEIINKLKNSMEKFNRELSEIMNLP
ncbi:MAG: hypothetical protein ACTSYQ_01890, partial [Candidatus Odinarchaeia archaeon]